MATVTFAFNRNRDWARDYQIEAGENIPIKDTIDINVLDLSKRMRSLLIEHNPKGIYPSRINGLTVTKQIDAKPPKISWMIGDHIQLEINEPTEGIDAKKIEAAMNVAIKKAEADVKKKQKELDTELAKKKKYDEARELLSELIEGLKSNESFQRHKANVAEEIFDKMYLELDQLLSCQIRTKAVAEEIIEQAKGVLLKFRRLRQD